MQRIFDIFISGLSLLVLSPLLLPIAILLRLTGEGEVFFLQSRVGKGGKAFQLYKFATMLKDSPNMGTGTVTLKNDPRILPMGHFLRKTKINELPQLLNILCGDMSIVGPRPQTQRCFDAFLTASQKAIVQVRPGLSGIGSIIFHAEENMLHGQADSVLIYDEVIAPYKGVLEEWYVANQGLRTYLLCIGLTAWVMLNSDSNVVWRVFDTLPKPSEKLAPLLKSYKKGLISNKEIYRQVAYLHSTNLDQGFLATMGVSFLAELYRAIDNCPQSVLIVQCEQGKVVGFVSGVSASKSVVFRRLMRRFLIWSIPLFPVLVSPARMSSLAETLRYVKSESAHRDLPIPELLSIVVAPNCRGRGIAESLYANLNDYFRQIQVSKFKILVGKKLLTAQKFYIRMGAQPLIEMELHQGFKSVLYVHTVTKKIDLPPRHHKRYTVCSGLRDNGIA